MPLTLPIGLDNFGKLIQSQLTFVDKSLFIKAIIDDIGAEIIVITRPRRFGKTLNLSMLQHFFAPEVYGLKTQGLFDHLDIATSGSAYMQHQGKYPVIFISFKDISDYSFEPAVAKLKQLLAKVYAEHEYLLSSDKLTPPHKIAFEQVLTAQTDLATLGESLANLTRYLTQYHGVKPYLLIDEYDSPLQSAFLHGYYDAMLVLLRHLFSAALKTNPYLHKAVMTGVLRIAKDSLFSGLNNIKIYSLLQQRYSTYFGFTGPEVNALLQQADLAVLAAPIRDWYNGYLIGDTTIYNPWSIVNCIDTRGTLQPYWVNTSDNQLLRRLLTRSNGHYKQQFAELLADQTISTLIDDNVAFNDLDNNSSAIWSLLLMAGYLKVVRSHRDDQGLWCDVTIPSREVRNLYRQMIERWLSISILSKN